MSDRVRSCHAVASRLTTSVRLTRVSSASAYHHPDQRVSRPYHKAPRIMGGWGICLVWLFFPLFRACVENPIGDACKDGGHILDMNFSTRLWVAVLLYILILYFMF